jgi:hypothetical protein
MKGVEIQANLDRLRPMLIDALSDPELRYGVVIDGLTITDAFSCPRVKVVMCQADNHRDTSGYWCIELDGRRPTDSLAHEYNDADKRELMRCLLQLEGDTRRSGSDSHNVQLEALHLIRRLLGDPQQDDESIQEPEIERAFRAYREGLDSTK